MTHLQAGWLTVSVAVIAGVELVRFALSQLIRR